MKLDGIGLFVNDMATMVRFYRDVLGFEIKEGEDAVNVYLIKDGTLFMLYEPPSNNKKGRILHPFFMSCARSCTLRTIPSHLNLKVPNLHLLHCLDTFA